MSKFRIIPSSIFIGDHVSKLTSYSETIRSVLGLGNRTAFQMLVKNKLSTHSIPQKNIDEKDIKIFSELLETHCIKLVIHASYTYNLCGSKDPSNEEHISRNISNAKKGLVSELDLAVALNSKFYSPKVVVHMGSCRDKNKGIDIAIKTINDIATIDGELTEFLAKLKGVDKEEFKRRRQICLENCAGEGSKIWSTIEEAYRIYSHPELNVTVRENNLSFCIDTAHLYGKGIFNFGKEEDIDLFVKTWKEKGIPLAKISVIHLNDSKVSYGSFKDRHALIGLGRSFNIISQRKTEASLLKLLKMVDKEGELEGVPLILESPEDANPGIEWLWKIAEKFREQKK